MRSRWAWVRLLGGAAVLVVLALRLGAEPFVDGLRRTDATVVAFGLAATAGTTWCCAWRWSLLSRRLDVAVPVGVAYRLYYRSQLLNATLPGGVLGDLHRGVEHGHTAGALGRGVRSVLWDRAAGQAAQALLVAGTVGLLPSGVRSEVGWLLLGLVVAAVAVVALAPRRLRGSVAGELRTVAAGGIVPAQVGLASVLAAAGHVVVFVAAARSVGVDAPLPQLAALALVVLLASALPLNVAGWGPREGVTAWLFAQAGLSAATGLSVAVVYGVVSLVATLPGVLVLARPPARGAPSPWPSPRPPERAVARG